MISLIKIILLLTIFLIPLIGPIRGLGYEQSKVFFFIFSLTICGFLWTIYSIKYPVRLVWSMINITALTFIVILFLTSFLGVDPFNSFTGNQPYFQGWILYAYLYLFFLLVSWLNIKLRIWTYILVGSSAIVGIFAIFQWVQLNLLHQFIPNYAGRVVSTFGQPNFYSGFILLTLPFAYMLFKSQEMKIRRIGLISGIISIVGIFVSYSRAAILMVLFLMILALATHLKIKPKLKSLSFSFLPIILLVSIIMSFRFSSGIFWRESLEPTNTQWLINNSPEKRILIWPVILNIIAQRPLFGYGLENMEVGFSNFFKSVNFNVTQSPTFHSLKDITLDRSHNYMLDLLFFSGILGFLIWILLVVLLVKKVRSKVLLAGLIVYLIWVQFQNQSVIHILYFWLIAGLINSEFLDNQA